LSDHRPARCRNRLMDEGKPYPRSGCSACGWTVFSPTPEACRDPKASARDAIRNAALREAAAKIREMPWWRVDRSWTDRQGKAWPMVEALTQDDYANAILDMIEETSDD